MNPDILAAGRALRVDLQPQLRGPPGPRRAHASRLPADGRRGRHRGALRRHPRVAMSAAAVSIAGAGSERDVAASFADQRRSASCPLLELQEDVLARVLDRQRAPDRALPRPRRGRGAVSELVLATQPRGRACSSTSPSRCSRASRATLADSRRALAGRARRPLRRRWRDALPAGATTRSSRALRSTTCRRSASALFAEVFDAAGARRMFANMDYVAIDGPLRGLFDEQMAANAAADARAGEHATSDPTSSEPPGSGDEDRATDRRAAVPAGAGAPGRRTSAEGECTVKWARRLPCSLEKRGSVQT